MKKIAIVGRARVGKSRVSSRFCKNSNLVVKNFTSSGKDCTPVNFRYVVKRDCTEDANIIRFISPGSTLNGIEAPFTEEGIVKFLNMLQNNTYAQSNSLQAGEKKNLDPRYDIIEIITEASDLALEIMTDEEEELIITDTPGVSGDVEGLQNVSDADLYIFVMRPENAKEYAESIGKMLPVIAGSRVLFVYRMDEPADNDSEYILIEEDARKAMREFESDLDVLKTSIINTSIEVLNPSSTVIPMGAFSKTKINYAEKKFNEILISSLKKVFSENIYEQEELAIIEALNNTQYDTEAIVEYIREITNKYIETVQTTATTSYKATFLAEKHDRVKFNDGEVTLTLVNENRTALLNKLYNCFNVLTVSNQNISKVAKMLQENIIRYVYKKTSKAIKFDCGMSSGNHPFETQPPITMWAEEAVIAEDLINNNGLASTNMYCQVMRNMGYTSKSWPYVSITNNPYKESNGYCNRKLEVICKCGLNKLPSANRKELIYNSYNLALLKLGQYAIYQFVIDRLGLPDDPITWM